MNNPLFFSDVNSFAFLIGKAVILLFLLMYIIFAGVVIKQVSNMTETIDVGLAPVMKLLSVIHFAFAIFVFVTALFVL